jgi:cytochrome c oxidase subunit 2
MAATVGGFMISAWRPPVASEHGRGVDTMITYLLLVTGVIFVIGHLVLGFFTMRYSGNGKAGCQGVSRRAEWLWTIIPVLGMTILAEGGSLIIGIPVWQKVYGKAEPDAIDVEVVSKQFEWLIRYPGKDKKYGKTDPRFVHTTRNPVGLDKNDPNAVDDIVMRGVLHLASGRMATVRLRSHDVIHSFSVPHFRIKQDIIPGYTGHTQFRPDVPGQFEIVCAELCGIGHHQMRGLAIVLTPVEFQKWLSEQKGWFEEDE